MKELLSKSPLFSGLSDAEQHQALDLMQGMKKEYKKGDYLRLTGEKSTKFGFVLRGTLQVCCDDIDGNVMIMATVSQGDTFGESLCYLAVSESPVYIRSFSDSCVLWLSTEGLGDCKNPLSVELLRRFSAMLAARALNMNDRIQILSKPTIREKLTAFFTQCERNFGSNIFSVPFDRESMAAYLGTNRSALSRELSNMQKEGRITFYKNTFKIIIKE